MNTTIDTLVIVIFSAFVLGIGMLFARTGRNLKSFFAGGEAVPWFIGGLSLFMSFFSAGTFVAWGSIAYTHGWVAITIQWTMCIGALVTGLYLAPRWKATGALTAAEFIRERLGVTVQKVYILIFTLVSLFIKGSVLYPVARLVSSSLNLPLVPCTIGLGIFMIAYTAVGGLWAVMVTDILQFVVLSAAVFILLPLSLDKVGGFNSFVSQVPPDFFDLLHGDYTFGFIMAFVFYHIAYIGGNWTFVQRYTSVDSPRSARKVAFLFAGLYLISPIIWMLPPMIYRAIDPSLAGLDTENAYLKICQLVLPPGLLGLMLTGMYFSTSASANTALNVVSAVFTNDIYKGLLNPGASDKQLIRVARGSSWLFGLGMIGIALMVPAAGGVVEVVLSISAISGGPLLAPPLWALFSSRLTGRATLWITGIGLTVNLFFKVLSPWLLDYKLTRAAETVIGVGLPLLLLLAYELWAAQRTGVAQDSANYQVAREEKREAALLAVDPDEVLAIKKQNQFGLRVIAASLLFTALMLFGLSFLTTKGAGITAGIAGLVLLGSIIPWRASRRARRTYAKVAAAVCLAGCTLSVASAQYTIRQPGAIPLHGEWLFALDPAQKGETGRWFATGQPLNRWDKVTVPHCFSADPRYLFYNGKVWYRKTFPWQSTAGNRVLLHFDAAFYATTIYLNNQKVGTHEGGYTPFQVDITRFLQPGENVLTVSVDNDTWQSGTIPGAKDNNQVNDPFMGWINYGGLIRPVYLTVEAPVYIENLKVEATPDLAKGTALLRVKARIRNTTGQAVSPRLAVSLNRQGQLVAAQWKGSSGSVPANQTGILELETTLKAADVRLWSPDSPSLYALQASVGPDTVSTRFGIRKVEVRNAQLLLNGQPIKMAGGNRVVDYPGLGSLEPDWLVEKDMKLMKEAGMELHRLTHYTPSETVYDWADQHGMLIITEAGNWQLTPRQMDNDTIRAKFRQQFREMAERDWNHPSVIAYSVGNEYLSEQPAGQRWTKDMIAYARELDPTRLYTFASMRLNILPKKPEDEASQYCDFVSTNTYGNHLNVLKHIHSLYPDKPIFISEYGTRADGREAEAGQVAYLDKFLADIRSLPYYVIGASWWSFNDYRSRYQGTNANGYRPWGLVGPERDLRLLYRAHQTGMAPLTVEKTGWEAGPEGVHQLTLRVTARADFPAYAIRGYRLKMNSITRGIPDLQPGQTADLILPVRGFEKSATLEISKPTGFSILLQTIDLTNDTRTGNR